MKLTGPYRIELDVHVHDHYGRPVPHSTLDQRLAGIETLLHALARGLDHLMSTQDDIDAAVTELGVNMADLDAASVRIMEEIAQLQDAGVNTDGLMAALNALDVSTGKIANIVPVPVVDPPTDPVDPPVDPPVDETPQSFGKSSKK